MDKNYIVNHLKDMVKQSEKTVQDYKNIGHVGMERWSEGVKDGLELAIQWIEDQED